MHSEFSRRSLLKLSAASAAVGASGGCMPSRSGDDTLAEWSAESMPDLSGRTAIVTGANGYPHEGRSGLGYHQALGLVRAGADVIIASRNQERGLEAVRRMRAEVPGGAVRFETLDLANLASVRDFSGRMRAAGEPLDLLINNAGVMSRLHREESVDGFERVFATNALGPFALTAQVLPLLRAAPAPRVVWMSSARGHMGSINFDDLQKERDFDYGAAYNDSKLANLLLAFECERRSVASDWGLSSIAAHPGVARTNLIPDGPGLESAEGFRFRNFGAAMPDASQGALPILYAATAPGAEAGGYYGPGGPMGLGGAVGVSAPPERAQDLEVATRLWTTLEQLSETAFG